MRKQFFVVTLAVMTICFSAEICKASAGEWSDWQTLYSGNGASVHISFKLSSCSGSSLAGYSFYRFYNENALAGAKVEADFTYTMCDNKTGTEHIILLLDKTGIIEDMGKWFTGHKVNATQNIKFKAPSATASSSSTSGNSSNSSAKTTTGSQTNGTTSGSASNKSTTTGTSAANTTTNQSAKVLSELDAIATSNKQFQDNVASAMAGLTELFYSSIRTKQVTFLKNQRTEALSQLKQEIRDDKGAGILEECSGCDGHGVEICSTCDSNGYQDCYMCQGNGESKCWGCSGTGSIAGMTCTSCGGEGNNKCTTCHGAGTQLCDDCHGVCYDNCTLCMGIGRLYKSK